MKKKRRGVTAARSRVSGIRGRLRKGMACGLPVGGHPVTHCSVLTRGYGNSWLFSFLIRRKRKTSIEGEDPVQGETTRFGNRLTKNQQEAHNTLNRPFATPHCRIRVTSEVSVGARLFIYGHGS